MQTVKTPPAGILPPPAPTVLGACLDGALSVARCVDKKYNSMSRDRGALPRRTCCQHSAQFQRASD